MDQYRESKNWIELKRGREREKKRVRERGREKEKDRQTDRQREREREWKTVCVWEREREKILNVRELDNKKAKLRQSETKMNSIENGSEDREERRKLKRSKIKKNE